MVDVNIDWPIQLPAQRAQPLYVGGVQRHKQVSVGGRFLSHFRASGEKREGGGHVVGKDR